MRALITILVSFVVVAAGATTALAAPSAQTIAFALNGQYQSLFGGYDSARATFDGTINGDQLSRLRGTIDFGITSENISVDQNAPATIGDQTFPVYWQRVVCDPFGCSWTSGTSTFTHNAGVVPVDLRVGQLRGSGTLSWAGGATCVADCPPAGSWYSVPYPYSSLNAAVTSTKEAGTLYLSGPAPLIQ